MRPHLARDLVRAAAVAAAVALLVLPLPTLLIDALLTAQLAAAIITLLVALSARPERLGAFPATLLGLTLLRLALNVATTRSILAHGEAGQIIDAFGRAVVGGDFVVGLVVFAVLTVAQYLVVAKGAERVAAVSARFALDALPGRQAAIDAEQRAGRLPPEAARARREGLDRTSALYGAMDGAMRFVRGDALAGLCIVAVNITGGLLIGLWRRDLPLEAALATYTTLTIGDGLAAQVPAVLQTAAAAIIATRLAAPSTDLSPLDARPLYGTAALFAGLAALPGLPAAPLLAVAGGLGLAARFNRPRRPTPIAPAARYDTPLALILHPLAAHALDRDPDLVVADARARLARHHGLHLPAARIDQNPVDIVPAGYRIELDGAPLATGLLLADQVFVCPCPPGDEPPLRHPHHDAPGRWVASGPGIDPAEYLATHLTAVWRRAGPAALGLQTLADRIADLERRQPALVRAVVPSRLTLPRLAAILRALLADGLSVRDLATLLEHLAAQPDDLDDPTRLARLRAALAPALAARHAPIGRLACIHAAPALEAQLADPTPDLIDALIAQLDALRARYPTAALIVSDPTRPAARALLAPHLPGLPILAHRELPTSLITVTVGLVDGDA